MNSVTVAREAATMHPQSANDGAWLGFNKTGFTKPRKRDSTTKVQLLNSALEQEEFKARKEIKDEYPLSPSPTDSHAFLIF